MLLGLAMWFGAELMAGSAHVGVAERVLGAAQATWPLAVIVSCRLSQASGRHEEAISDLSRPGRPDPGR